MVRYLSAAWFERLSEVAPELVAPRAGEPSLVLRQVITEGPEGDVSYEVVVADGKARIDQAPGTPADLTFTSDYRTASAIAAGELSTQAALAAGRLKVSGDVTVLATRSGDVSGLDAIPAELRAVTEY
jgi:putative sterol carrier protein